ncbi:hypothetical protein ACU4GD_39270 [Cupriavidus basilensis]
MADESALILPGYIAFIDPPMAARRPGLRWRRAAAASRSAVLTGDSPVIARKICREVGIDVDRAVLGHELDGLSPQALGELAERTQLFAKLAPAHKAALASGPAGARTGGGRAGRRHQRRTGAQGGRRRHLGGQRRRYRQGIGQHHPAGKEPAGAARRRDRRPQGLCQPAQVPAHGCQLEFRQYVQRLGAAPGCRSCRWRRSRC